MEETIKNTAEAVPEKIKEKSAAKPKTDKLTALKIKQEKAAAAVEKAAKKAKAIDEEIAAEEKKQHDREIKQLDGICKNMKIELADVTNLIKLISENGLTVSEAAKLIGAK